MMRPSVSSKSPYGLLGGVREHSGSMAQTFVQSSSRQHLSTCPKVHMYTKMCMLSVQISSHLIVCVEDIL